MAEVQAEKPRPLSPYVEETHTSPLHPQPPSHTILTRLPRNNVSLYVRYFSIFPSLVPLSTATSSATQGSSIPQLTISITLTNLGYVCSRPSLAWVCGGKAFTNSSR